MTAPIGILVTPLNQKIEYFSEYYLFFNYNL